MLPDNLAIFGSGGHDSLLLLSTKAVASGRVYNTELRSTFAIRMQLQYTARPLATRWRLSPVKACILPWLCFGMAPANPHLRMMQAAAAPHSPRP
jgi:hypothetical protein